jgi:hypothetical protein
MCPPWTPWRWDGSSEPGWGDESIKNLGVGRSGFRFELQIWMPPVEDRAEFLIESFHPRLQ